MEDEKNVDETPVMPISFDPKAVKPVSREELLPSNRGGLILCLGIVGVSVCCLGIILGPIATIMARSDLKRIKNKEMSDSGRLAVVIGQILGILSTLLGIAGIVLAVLGGWWVTTVQVEEWERWSDDSYYEVPADEGYWDDADADADEGYWEEEAEIPE
ncbi:MAG: DUF4190 domain-containing protein [Planctomycetota bacterium]|nr:DUF4190 domain-containing protein [Planctomycetota bacterium]